MMLLTLSDGTFAIVNSRYVIQIFKYQKGSKVYVTDQNGNTDALEVLEDVITIWSQIDKKA